MLASIRMALLAGILLGAVSTATIYTAVNLAVSYNTRLSAVEGYIRGLDQFLRQATGGR